MKFLFINLNLDATPGINHGIAILAAVLKQAGHKADCLTICDELGMPFERSRIEEEIRISSPDVIGLSLVETQQSFAKILVSDLRKYFKGIIIAGGPYPTMDSGGVLEDIQPDAVCIGEGEGAILQIAAGIPLDIILNIRLAGQPIPKLHPLVNLVNLPAEDLEIFPLDKIVKHKNGQLEIAIGRGCPYSCTYCINESYRNLYRENAIDIPTRKQFIRERRSSVVIQEIKDAVERHPGIKKIAFVDDDLFTYHPMNLIFKYSSKIGLPWVCNVNPNSFRYDDAQVYRAAGCDTLRFGVESGSARILKNVLQRPVNLQKTEGALDAARILKFKTSIYCMIGIPTESREEVEETLALVARMRPDFCKIMTFFPFRNTPLYDQCESRGIIDHAVRDGLLNFDTGSCLKFDPDYLAWLRDVQENSHNYINHHISYGPRYVKYSRSLAVLESIAGE